MTTLADVRSFKQPIHTDLLFSIVAAITVEPATVLLLLPTRIIIQSPIINASSREACSYLYISEFITVHHKIELPNFLSQSSNCSSLLENKNCGLKYFLYRRFECESLGGCFKHCSWKGQSISLFHSEHKWWGSVAYCQRFWNQTDTRLSPCCSELSNYFLLFF